MSRRLEKRTREAQDALSLLRRHLHRCGCDRNSTLCAALKESDSKVADIIHGLLLELKDQRPAVHKASKRSDTKRGDLDDD